MNRVEVAACRYFQEPMSSLNLAPGRIIRSRVLMFSAADRRLRPPAFTPGLTEQDFDLFRQAVPTEMHPSGSVWSPTSASGPGCGQRRSMR